METDIHTICEHASNTYKDVQAHLRNIDNGIAGIHVKEQFPRDVLYLYVGNSLQQVFQLQADYF